MQEVIKTDQLGREIIYLQSKNTKLKLCVSKHFQLNDIKEALMLYQDGRSGGGGGGGGGGVRPTPST